MSAWHDYTGHQRTVYEKQILQVEGKFDVEIVSLADSAATLCWCYLSFGCCSHMVDFAKSSHTCLLRADSMLVLDTCL